MTEKHPFFDMQRVPGIPLALYLQRNPHARTSSLVDLLTASLAPFHEVLPPKHIDAEQVEADIVEEALTKAVARLEEAWPIIQHFQLLSVNGVTAPVELVGAIGALERCLDLLLEHYQPKASSCYRLIHGDPNFSNVLIDPVTNALSFIDPRGYFGATACYGPPDYDLAKVKQS